MAWRQERAEERMLTGWRRRASTTPRRPPVHLGVAEIDVAGLDGDRRRIRGVITRWEKKRDYWFDTGFQEFNDHKSQAPQLTEVLLRGTEGPLCIDAGLGVCNGDCESSFQKMLAKEGYLVPPIWRAAWFTSHHSNCVGVGVQCHSESSGASPHHRVGHFVYYDASEVAAHIRTRLKVPAHG